MRAARRGKLNFVRDGTDALAIQEDDNIQIMMLKYDRNEDLLDFCLTADAGGVRT